MENRGVNYLADIKIGKKLKALRKAKNYTAAELAEKVDVSQAYISKIENDKASPNLEMLNKILIELDSNLQLFFSCDDPNPQEDMIKVFQQVKALKPEVREKLIDLLEEIK